MRQRHIHRTIRNLILLTILLTLLLWSGKVAFHPVLSFRVKEHTQMIGPAKITGRESFNCSQNQALIGVSEEGYSLFTYPAGSLSVSHRVCTLRYFPKGEAVTFFAPSDTLALVTEEKMELPVFLFATDPSAFRAEMTITVINHRENSNMEETLTSETTLCNNGYYMLKFDVARMAGSPLLQHLQHRLSGQPSNYPTISACVFISLYDGAGNLLSTHTFPLDEITE